MTGIVKNGYALALFWDMSPLISFKVGIKKKKKIAE